jgi:large subunit ribosomal protein L6
MSRVGKKPISIPGNVKISYDNRLITVEGEKGKLSRTIHPSMDLDIKDGVISVVMEVTSRTNQALQGLTRSLFQYDYRRNKRVRACS